MFLSMIESFFLVQYNFSKNLYIQNHPPDIFVNDKTEKWVRLDFSLLTSNEEPEVLKRGLVRALRSIWERYSVNLKYDDAIKVQRYYITSRS